MSIIIVGCCGGIIAAGLIFFYGIVLFTDWSHRPKGRYKVNGEWRRY